MTTYKATMFGASKHDTMALNHRPIHIRLFVDKRLLMWLGEGKGIKSL